ncbi:hypothetical protein [Halomonas sp. Y3]|uniref:hypothetical protein n=1 Tax=Halomonas sp. Y3 TaxID=2956797 RepID=UPI00209F517F|nr:hypothetical protein [Halomonas sp. Y3]
MPIVHLTAWRPTDYAKADHAIQSIEDWVELAGVEPSTLVFGHADPLSLVQLPLLVYNFSSVPEEVQHQLAECIITGLETGTAQTMSDQASAGL